MSDLRQFRHFVALAEHGHYARAAEAVNLSQPALSRSIQALEGQLGCTLVERGSRGVALTAHGRLVLEHARRLLAGHRALHNAVSQLANLDSGELRLGGGPFPAARLLPEALAGFSSAHPRVRVVLLIEDWQTLRQRLLDDAVELFVADIRELQGDPQLRIHPLREYPGVLFCRPGHPLLRLVRPSAEQLADYPLAGPRLPEAVRGDLARLLQREEPLGIQCDDVLMLKGLVGSSELISLAPWDVVAADVEAGRLALLPWPAGSEPARAKGSAYGLVSRAGRGSVRRAGAGTGPALRRHLRISASERRRGAPARNGSSRARGCHGRGRDSARSGSRDDAGGRCGRRPRRPTAAGRGSAGKANDAWRLLCGSGLSCGCGRIACSGTCTSDCAARGRCPRRE